MINQIIFGNQNLIDLRGDTITADKLLTGFTAHDASGEIINGSMVNNGAVTGLINDISNDYTIPAGYHNGNGSVDIDNTEKEKIIAGNIKKGVSILGITGNYPVITLLTAITTDFANGYVSNYTWTYQANSANRADIYQVQANHSYFCRRVTNSGNRWRGVFVTSNPVNATANISGHTVVYHNENTVPNNACFAYTPRVNGYIAIVKSNQSENGIVTEMIDITNLDFLFGA